jgi:acyl dehydratase
VIDPDVAVGATLPDRPVSWSTSDVLLYHLALGIGSGRVPGSGPLDDAALRYVHEPVAQVLPTFGVMPVRLGATEPVTYDYPGVRVDPSCVLHGSQSVTIHRPLPADGAGVLSVRVAALHDKGSAAVLTEESETRDDDGLLVTARSQLFLRGEGGFGGDRGPSRPSDTDLSPDDPECVVLDLPTAPGQALLYRLCGDRNPLHSDPGFARTAGFDRPILHGLCTWGMVCHALVERFLDGDATRVREYGAWFAGVVLPGDLLRVVARVTDEGVRARVTVPARGDATVLDGVRLTPVGAPAPRPPGS